MKRLSVSYVS